MVLGCWEQALRLSKTQSKPRVYSLQPKGLIKILPSDEYHTNHLLQKKYGITFAQYKRMLKAQHGVCKICGEKPRGRLLAVDHNHITGENRGLLCMTCNTGLGMFRDSPRLLARAIVYLEENGATY